MGGWLKFREGMSTSPLPVPYFAVCQLSNVLVIQ